MSVISRTDVSRNALSVARMLDRLGTGKFTITLIKGEGSSERWQVEIAQPVTIQKKELTQEVLEDSIRIKQRDAVES